MKNITFPEIYTVWVIRNDNPYFIHATLSLESANDYGNKHISTQDFVVKVFKTENVVENKPCCPPSEPVSEPLDTSKLSWTTDSSAIDLG